MNVMQIIKKSVVSCLMISLFLVVVSPTTSKLCAIGTSKDGIVLNRSDAIGVVVGGVSGSVAYLVIKKLLQEKLFSPDNERKDLYTGFLAAGVGATIGLCVDLILSYLSAKKQKRYDSFDQAKILFEQVLQAEVYTVSFGQLLAHLQNYYGDKDPYGKGLENLEVLQAKLDNARVLLGVATEEITGKKDGKLGDFCKKCQDLVDQIPEVYQEVIRRQRFVLREYEYSQAALRLLDKKERIDEVLGSDQLSSVKESDEQTIVYGITSIDSIWPLIELVKDLRNTMNEVRGLLQSCNKYWSLCHDTALEDPRYERLAQGYKLLIERISEEFSFELFEKRIHAIFSSDQYREEIKILESDKKHKELVRVMEGIRNDLERIVGDVKHELAYTNITVQKVQQEFGAVGNRMNHVEGTVTSMKNFLVELKSELLAIKNELLALRGDVSQIVKPEVVKEKPATEK